MIAYLLTSLCLSAAAPSGAEADNSIPALAASSGRLDTLVTAVTAANLVDALSSHHQTVKEVLKAPSRQAKGSSHE